MQWSVGAIDALGPIGPLPRVTTLIHGNIVARLETSADAILASLPKTDAGIGKPVRSEQA
jgi:hypothetical protein